MTPGLYIDMGSTNTRVWLMRGREVLASARTQAGVADTARDGSNEKICDGLKKLIAEVSESLADHPEALPRFAIGAGMIGSALGLAEVPHVAAPAGEKEIAAAMQPCRFPEFADLPFYLVPGVRVENGPGRDAPIGLDIMRGEEVLCFGLLRHGILTPSSTLLHLGSHWKAITLDDRGRISSSVTTLSGELIQAVRTQTILAGSIPREWPNALDPEWVEAGIREQEKSSLPRALFAVRLLEQQRAIEPHRCFAFLCGAVIGADLEILLHDEPPSSKSRIAIAGGESLATAWQQVLARRSLKAFVCSRSQREDALLTGLHRLAESLSSLPV